MRMQRHIMLQFLATIAIVVMGAVSCSREFPAFLDDDSLDGSFYINVQISLPTDVSTKASYSYLDSSVEWENYVDYSSDLHFYFFGEDNKFITHLSPSDMVVMPHNYTGVAKYKTYTVRGWLKTPPTGKFKLMVLANCGPDNYPVPISGGKLRLSDNTEVDDIDGVCRGLTFGFGYSAVTSLNPNRLIPMFGISDLFTDKPFVLGECTDVGDIFLLRAFAKVEVCVSEDETADLSSVVLHNYNRNGLCAPLNVLRQNDYMLGGLSNAEADFMRHVSIPTSPDTQTGASATWPLADNGKTIHYTPSGGTPVDRKVYTIYVPEYRNLVANADGTPSSTLVDNPSYMTLTFDDGDERVFNLYFKDYATNTPFDIQRNNYYRYTVNRTMTDLRVNVSVVPYIGLELNPNFGITAPYIQLNKSAINLFPGAIFDDLVATVMFYELSGDDSITFSIDNTQVARLDGSPVYSNGNKTATVRVISHSNILEESMGQTLLTVKCGPLTKVIPIINGPARVSLSRSRLDMLPGWTRKIDAGIYASNPLGDTVTWTSDDPSVATVDANGNVTAVASGTTSVRATFVRAGEGGTSTTFTSECVVEVGEPRITFDSFETLVATQGKVQFVATVWPAEYQTSAIQWSSSNTNVATVSATGLVETKNRNNQTTVITASYRDVSASVTITTKKPVLTLNETSITLANGSSRTLYASISPTGRNLTVKWQTSNSSFVTVINGEIERKGTGNVIITAYCEEDNTIKATCTVR